MKKVVVVGAGISGLTAAYELHSKGIAVQVIEAGEHPGGLIQTRREDGFITECGPHTFPSTATDLVDLCRRLGLKPQPASPQAKKRYLYLNGKLQALPHGPADAFTTGILSPAGKLRALQGLWGSKVTGTDLTLANFFEKRFGAEVVENLLDPFISGVYAGDIRSLSIEAAFPKLWQWEQEYGNFLKGALASKKSQSAKKPKYEMLSFEGGMAILTRALVNALPSEAVRCNLRVLEIKPSAHGYDLILSNQETLSCTDLILATPAYAASSLLKPFIPTVAGTLADIPYNALNVVHYGFEKNQLNHPLDGFGCLIPRRENVPLLGTIWASSLFQGRSPEGQALLTNFIGGAHHPEISAQSPEEIAKTVLGNLRTIFRNPDLSPVFQRVLKYERAIPQYTQGHLKRVETIETALRDFPNLKLTGNYLNGISLGECARSGLLAVAFILRTI